MRAIAVIPVGLAAWLAHASDVRPVSEIAALIEAAEPHATIRVSPGEYHGSLRITRPVTLEGDGLVVIDGRGAITVVELLSAGVTFRGFTVRGTADQVGREPAAIRAETGPVVIENNRIEDALYGIDIRQAPGSEIRGNVVSGKDFDESRRGDGIRLWWSHGCVIEGNRVDRSRDMVFWYSQNLDVRGNTVTRSRYGLHFMYSHDTTLTDNDLTDNSVGVYLMYSNNIRLVGNRIRGNRGSSGYGIGLKDCDGIVIERNLLLANRVGAYVDNSPSSLDSTGLFASNLFAFNEIGVLATPLTHNNVFTGNAFIENEEQAASHGRGDLRKNAFALDGVGNFWSDYAGFDLDGDGIGDLAHEPRSLFGALLAREPNLRLFVHSPAQRAVEFTARALPELRPEPTLIDPAPLARPPVFEGTTHPAPASRAMALLAAALIGVAGACWTALGRDPRLTARERRDRP